MNIDTSKFPPVPKGFDKWIVWDSCECPIPNDTVHCILFGNMETHKASGKANSWAWGWSGKPEDCNIVAYCLKKDTQEAKNTSIRDDFAKHIMAGILSDNGGFQRVMAGKKYYAEACYEIADAMIEASKTKE